MILEKINENISGDLIDEDQVQKMYMELLGLIYLALDSDEFPLKILKSLENTSKILGSKDQDFAVNLFRKIIGSEKWFYLREPE